METERFNTLMEALLSADNNTRDQGEAEYKRLVESQPEQVVQLLGQVLLSGQGHKERVLATVLLRQQIRSNTWANVSIETKGVITKSLINVLEADSNVQIMRKVVHLLVALPKDELCNMEQLIDWTVSMVGRSQAADKKCVFIFLLGKLAEFAYMLVEKSLSQVVGVLKQCIIQTEFVECQLFAAESTTSIVLSCTRPKELQGFLEECIPHIMQAMVKGFSPDSTPAAHDQAVKALQSLSALTSKSMWALDKNLASTCVTLLQLAECGQLDDESRGLALTLFTEIFVKRGKTISKNVEFIDNVLQLLFRLQCEDIEWEDDWTDDFQPVATDALMLLTPGIRSNAVAALITVGSHVTDQDVFLKQLVKVAAPSLQDTNAAWKQKCAATTAIGAIADPLAKCLRPQVGDVIQNLRPQFSDANQRVVYCALACLYELISAPGLEGCFKEAALAEYVIGTLLQILNNANSTTAVRCMACQCLAVFLNEANCNFALLKEKYLKRLLQTLAIRLSQGALPEKEDAMVALSRAAAIAGESFGEFYDDFVPGIIQVIASPVNGEVDNAKVTVLRNAAMSCVATIAEAVGKERFMGDSNRIMSLLLQTNSDDLVQLDGVFDFSKRLSAVLESDFLPYLPHILPVIYQAIKADLNLSLEDVDADAEDGTVEEAGDNGQFSMVKDVRGTGKFKVTANIYAFQMKINALEALDMIVDSLGAGFAPHLEEALQIVLPVVSETWNPMAAINAADTAVSLLHAAWKSLNQMGHAMDPAQKLLVTISQAILQGLMEASQRDANDAVDDDGEMDDGADRRIGFASSFERIVRICWFSGGETANPDGSWPSPSLTPPEKLVPHMTTVLRDVAGLSVQRRHSAADVLASKGYEEATVMEVLEDLNSEEAGFMVDVIDSIGYLLKLSGPSFLPTFESVLHPLLSVLIRNNQSPELNHNAICLYDDAIQYCGPGAHKYLDTCFPAMLRCASSDNALLQQAAIYGIGQVVEKAPEYFAPKTNLALQVLIGVISKPDARDEDNLDSTENAVSVIGKICNHHPTQVQTNQLWPLWLSNLPLTSDEEEAMYSHKTLCRLVSEKNQDLFGSGNQNTEKVIYVLSTILTESQKEDAEIKLADDETLAVVPQLLGNLLSTLDSRQKQAIIQQFPGLGSLKL
mmetsp:Transcript_3418/g.6552  ORF Transcript_3418/g.6552 Transcript_3418/m.6552 type:complete len:1153 (-) Transcript_3418:37-3495(-)